jgi:gliding motility-associated-like protein
MNKVLYFCCFLLFSQGLLAQSPDFTVSSDDGLYCNPSRVTFTSTVAGSPVGYIWTFGNGMVSNSKNPTITYTTAGTFNVTLLVIYSRNTSQVSKSITIHPAVTSTLAVDRDFICAPGAINFTSTSSAGSPTYEWNFGDGSGIETTTSGSISHNFNNMGTFNVTLKAISEAGCSVTKTTSVRLTPIAVSGSVSVDSGCIPATTRLIASPSIPRNSTVASYEWDFNDGTPNATTTANAINHTYANTGSFRPKVKVTTSEGCETTLPYKTLGFGIPPTNHVASAEKDVICGSDSAVFFSKATNANSYFWDFGDGKTQYVRGNQVKHKYSTLGIKTITVTPEFNKCKGTPITFDIEVVGVIAGFSYKNTCQDQKTFNLTNTSQGNLSTILWNFGDGSPELDSRDVIHTYPASGAFRTSLFVEDDVTGCTDTYSPTLYTADAKLINEDTSICRLSTSTFTIEDNFAGTRAEYTWHIAGEVIGPLGEETHSLAVRKLGSFNNYVVINRGIQYCNDTLNLGHPYVVRGPDLNFTAPDALCFGNPYQVLNSSRPARPEDSVLVWHWNFGIDEVNDSTYQPDPFDFKSPGTFRVKLEATDIKGCTDSLVKNIRINPLPFLYVIPQTDTLCAGETAELIAFNSGVLNWKSTASLPCIDCDTIFVAPTVTSDFIANATSSEGCTQSDTISIRVFAPFAATPSERNPYICMNESVTISLSPPDKMIEWTPAAIVSNPNAYNITVKPRETTTYTVTMTDSVGCFSSTTDVIVNIKSLPLVDAGPDQILPYNSNFTINPVYSNNVTSYNWTPSNTLSCFSCPNPSGLLLDSKNYTIEVLSDSGCVAKDSINIVVECKSANLLIPNAFTPNNDNLNDIFYPIGRGIKTIRVFAIYDRFGQLVFERENFEPNDPNFGWNGKRNGMDQTSNVYVYYLEAECFLGEKLQKRGSVTLLR